MSGNAEKKMKRVRLRVQVLHKRMAKLDDDLHRMFGDFDGDENDAVSELCRNSATVVAYFNMVAALTDEALFGRSVSNKRGKP